MTTIVAVQRERGVTFASDSRVSWSTQHDGWVEKVITNGEVTIGTAGALRALQILRYASLPTIPSGAAESVDRFVTQELVPAIKKAFKDAESTDSGTYSNFIISVRGRVYMVCGSDGSWVRNPDGNYSIGSGAHFALGALAAGASPDRAVKIAARYDSGTNDDVSSLTIRNK